MTGVCVKTDLVHKKQKIESWETRDNKANGKLTLMNLVVSLCCVKNNEKLAVKKQSEPAINTKIKLENIVDQISLMTNSSVIPDNKVFPKIKNYELCSFQIKLSILWTLSYFKFL